MKNLTLVCFLYLCVVACSPQPVAVIPATEQPHATEIFTYPIAVQDVLDAKASDLAIAPDSTIWAATDQGLARFDGSQWQFITAPMFFQGLTIASNGTLWAYDNTHIGQFDNGLWNVYTPTLGSSSQWLYDLQVASDGMIWLAFRDTGFANSGLIRFNGYTWQTVPDLPDDMRARSHQNGRLLGIDHMNRPWVTFYRGSAYFDGEQWVWDDGWIEDAVFVPTGAHWAEKWGFSYTPERYPGGPGSIRGLQTVVAFCHQPASSSEVCYLKGSPLGHSSKGFYGIEIDSRKARPPVEMSTAILRHDIQAFTVASDNTLWAITVADEEGNYYIDSTLQDFIIAHDELVCFDGTTWSSYSLGHKGKWIRYLESAPDDSLWVVTEWEIAHLRLMGDCGF